MLTEKEKEVLRKYIPAAYIYACHVFDSSRFMQRLIAGEEPLVKKVKVIDNATQGFLMGKLMNREVVAILGACLNIYRQEGEEALRGRFVSEDFIHNHMKERMASKAGLEHKDIAKLLQERP